ncbi:PPOX class F420-dependent oxidoreductase [Nocardia sp. alder85J]|uniref:PPOX class F420-dependent oxidoreductase n=1 Tax=Nocardia sp. alder85J TaxID=2862949 RepID=UPI001CD3885A|nr:PPOX class F420-dependent oxidoreductase [Nocardia sp. alder85J]MCX4094005.1 PPOX class F420-dependent oxidoreductase [Nocardia sp. alder85J]
MGANQRAQITMSEAEIQDFLAETRILTLSTLGKSGLSHLTAMWYGLVDGEIWLETKSKSQKAVNLRRDPRVTVLVEAGHSYDQLRGVSIEGRAEVIEDPEALFRVGVSVWERYTAPYTEEARPLVAAMLNKRVAIRIVPERTRSWDHRKLGMPVMPPGGSTWPPRD